MKLIVNRIISEFNKIFSGTKRVGDSLHLEGRRMSALEVANAMTLGYKTESALNVNKSVLSDKTVTIQSFSSNGNAVVDGQGNPVYIKEHQLSVANSQLLGGKTEATLEVDIAKRLRVSQSQIVDVANMFNNAALYRVKDSALLGGKAENALYVLQAVTADNALKVNNKVEGDLIVKRAGVSVKLLSDDGTVERKESELSVDKAIYLRRGLNDYVDLFGIRDWLVTQDQLKTVKVNLASASNTLTTASGDKSFVDIMTYIKTDSSSEVYKATRFVTVDGAKTGEEHKSWLLAHADFSTRIGQLNANTANRAVRFGDATTNYNVTEMDARIKATVVDNAANATKLQNNTPDDLFTTIRSRILSDASNMSTGLTDAEAQGFIRNAKITTEIKAIKATNAGNADTLGTRTLSQVYQDVKDAGDVANAKVIWANPSNSSAGTKSYIDITSDITQAKNDLINGASTLSNTFSKVEVNVGTLSTLTTAAKGSLVAAINELDGEHGALTSLTTTTKTTLVAAINELDSDIGDRSALTTSAKTTLVAAINELDEYVRGGSLGNEVNKIESAVGLQSNGDLPSITGKNYINGQSSVLNAIYALDTQLKTTTDKFNSGVNRTSSTLTNAVVFDNLVVVEGVITGIGTRSLTPADIGASASGHTHLYAGSSSAGGAANSATTVAVTSTDASATYYPVITSATGTTTSATLFADNTTTPFSYNPNTGMVVPGAVSIGSSLTVTGDLTVNGTTTTINATTITVDDKNIELGSIASPTDATADTGGITLKGATDKTIQWLSATGAWTLSEHVNVATSKEYRIGGTSVLSSTTLGSGVTTSSLTTVGTITTGTWSAGFGAVSGANLLSLNASNLSTGTVAFGRLPALYIGTTTIQNNSAVQSLTGISSLVMSGSTSGTITLTPVAIAGTTNIAIPATNGTLITTNDTGTVTNGMIAAGTIANAKLVNDKVTVGTTQISLGSTTTTLAGLTSVSSTGFTGNLTGNVTGTAGSLATGRTISMTGDVSWTSGSFDGSTNVTGTSTLATITDSGSGTFKKISTDTKGRVIGTSAVTSSDITTTLSSASIANSKLENSSLTVNGQVISLGGSGTITANTPQSLVIKFDGGTTEGTDQYSFSGTSKTMNIKGGLHVSLDDSVAGEITIRVPSIGGPNNRQLSYLSTSNKDSLIEAINEIDVNVKSSNIGTLSSKVTTMAAAIGLSTDGTFNTTLVTGKNYIGGTTTVMGSVIALDSALKSTNDRFSTYDRTSSVLSGASVFSDVVVTDGVISSISTRNLTLADLDAASASHTHQYAGSDVVGGGATKVTVSSTDNNGVYYPTLVSAIGAATDLYADDSTTPFTYNPNSGAMNVPGSLTVTGNLTVNGTSVVVNSTVVNIEDPIFTLGGDTPPAGNDAKDRGIEFNWHDGVSAKIGFFGLDNSTGKFVFIPDASNTSEVFSGIKGTLDAYLAWSDVTNTPTTLSGYGITDAQTDITIGTTSEYYRGDKTWATLDKNSVGLSDVDNTSDVNKPVSLAQQNALDLKAPLESPTFTGTVSGITSAMVGLTNVEDIAISTWAGSTNITTVGTITSGIWSGTSIGDAYITQSSVTQHQAALSVTKSQISDFVESAYEPAIGTKKTAFNVDFGTLAGSVAEGNDSRILNGQSAYDWGNHASAGYLTSFTESDPIFTAWNKTDGISITKSQISDFVESAYEPSIIDKKTAFNVDFGTIAGTAATGDHAHTGVYEPADATILKSTNFGKAEIEAFNINAATVTGKTVDVNVPANAVFTDTTYTLSTVYYDEYTFTAADVTAAAPTENPVLTFEITDNSASIETDITSNLRIYVDGKKVRNTQYTVTYGGSKNEITFTNNTYIVENSVMEIERTVLTAN